MRLRRDLLRAVIESLSGPRYDLAEILPWCRERGIGNLDGAPGRNGYGSPDADADREALDRLTAAHHKALREHLVGLQSEPAINRFTALLAALGFDSRQQFLAMRALQLHVGASAPGGGAVMVVDLEAREPAAEWEREYREAVSGCMSAAQ